ncbi:MAG: AAA family ATPase, partial [Acidimicrobiales bacterium]
MLIHRLYLRNYRVYEDELDLALPGGLVGIFGPNGAGKSALIESIRWTLWGKSRTDKKEIRTSGVNADCITEVEFEHEGHLYLVRRTISGVGHTVKAEVHADGNIVNEGVNDVKRYLESVLGMDDTAFRASVFAEQKQLASFSTDVRPEQRRQLVLALLGITPLEGARDLARKDAREAKDRYDRLRGLLADVEALQMAAEMADAKAVTAEAEAETEAEVAGTAKERVGGAEAAVEALEAARREYDEIVADGKAARSEAERAAKKVDALTIEVAELDGLEQRIAELRPRADGLDAAQARLSMVERVVEAEEALRGVAVGDEPPVPDTDGLADAQRGAEQAAAALAETMGALLGAREQVKRVELALARAAEASADDVCPTCGQALGDAFAQVRAHRQDEVEAERDRVGALEARQVDDKEAAAAAAEALRQATATIRQAEQARRAWEQAATRKAEVQAR